MTKIYTLNSVNAFYVSGACSSVERGDVTEHIQLTSAICWHNPVKYGTSAPNGNQVCWSVMHTNLIFRSWLQIAPKSDCSLSESILLNKNITKIPHNFFSNLTKKQINQPTNPHKT